MIASLAPLVVGTDVVGTVGVPVGTVTRPVVNDGAEVEDGVGGEVS